MNVDDLTLPCIAFDRRQDRVKAVIVIDHLSTDESSEFTLDLPRNRLLDDIFELISNSWAKLERWCHDWPRSVRARCGRCRCARVHRHEPQLTSLPSEMEIRAPSSGCGAEPLQIWSVEI